MAKNNEIKWLEQRFALMRTHLQELKELQREQGEATQLMKQHHHQQRQQIVVAKDKTTRIGLIAIQTGQLTGLIIEFSQKRSLLVARQRQEELAQQERIERERGL